MRTLRLKTMKVILVVFSTLVCTGALVSSPHHPTLSRRALDGTWTTTQGSDRTRSTVQLGLCSIVNDRQGGVWITGTGFLRSGLMLSDRNGILRPVLASSVKTICAPIFVTAEQGWTIDARSLYRTNDGGSSWSKVEIPGLSEVTAVYFVDSQTGWAGGPNGQIYRSVDGGQKWAKRKAPVNYEVRQIQFVDSLNGWAVGYRYVSSQKRMVALFRSADGGENWEQLSNVDADSKDSVFSMFFLNHRDGWGTDGWQSKLIRTQDGGQSWTIQEFDSNRGWNAVFFVDALNGWAVGRGIVHTSDGGVTWKYQLDPDISSTQLIGITFTDPKHGWAIGLDKIFRTDDGGTVWKPLAEDWKRSLPN